LRRGNDGDTSALKIGRVRLDGRTAEDELIRTAHAERRGLIRVTFVLPADEPAGAVSVVGDFNGWDPFAHPLRRRSNGMRSAVVRLPAGSRSRFRYLAEGGLWFDDEAGASLRV
jgi:1,4-alpha-glucan branching enzyme